MTTYLGNCPNCGATVDYRVNDELSPASHCSSRPAEGLERQDADNAMCEAIAAFKPVCDDIVERFASRLSQVNLDYGQYSRAIEALEDVMQTTLRELTEKANSTPA